MHIVNQTWENNVAELSPQELLDRLAAVDVVVTTQTLRKWEADRLITPPIRGAGYGGRWSKYSEYTLAECYAAHMLLFIIPKKRMDKSVPKFSTEMLAEARMNCRFHPIGCAGRSIMKTTYSQQDSSSMITVADENIISQPQRWESSPSIDLSSDYRTYATAKQSDSFDTMLDFSILLCAELLWFKYLSEGSQRLGLSK